MGDSLLSRILRLPLIAACALLIAGCAVERHVPAAVPVASAAPVAAPVARGGEYDELEHRTFNFFWETSNPTNGLVPDRYPSPSSSSIAAIGFGLTAYPIGVERGYVTRAQARERVLATLRFFRKAPQGPEPRGMTGYKGFFYHFIDMREGKRDKGIVELSSVDSAIFIAGALVCAEYFDGAEPGEVEIRQLADELYRRMDWAWFANVEGGVALGWTPEQGFHPLHWRGYNEGMIIYLLGLGSPTHPLPDGAWSQWTEKYDEVWGTEYGQTYLRFPPLFGHQFSHLWVDFRGLQDSFMRAHGIDYFENTRRATYAQQAYAIANPMHWTGYGADLFGVSAADGPKKLTVPSKFGPRQFRDYAARGMGGEYTYDDGTLSPPALVSSLPFAPEIVQPAIAAMDTRYGRHLYSTYGYLDSFDPSFDYGGVEPTRGAVFADTGWVDGDYLGIDQGSAIGMIENYRSEFIWRLMRKNEYLRRGLERAGFGGGWLAAPR